MNKYTIRITDSSYKKLQRKLQKYEIKIGGMTVKNFLIANSIIEDVTNSTEMRIKRIVLHIGGDFDCFPGDLPNDMNLKINLRYGFIEFLLLRKRLDQLVKEYDRNAKVSAIEANACQTVDDCIDLINSKIVLNEHIEI